MIVVAADAASALAIASWCLPASGFAAEKAVELPPPTPFR